MSDGGGHTLRHRRMTRHTLGRSIEIAGVYFDDPVMEERFC
jgi:hypothetical protein